MHAAENGRNEEVKAEPRMDSAEQGHSANTGGRAPMVRPGMADNTEESQRLLTQSQSQSAEESQERPGVMI